MSYQVVQRADVDTYLRGRWNAQNVQLKVTRRDAGTGDLVESIEDTLDEVLDDLHALKLSQYTSDTARDGVEGELSVVLYKGLRAMPGQVLSDRDFWRYCACYLYDLVKFRQPSKDLEPFKAYFGVQSNGLGRDCVPHRMFNRARIAYVGGQMAGAEDSYSLARMRAGDTWKSHVLRVETGFAPQVIHHVLSDVNDGKLSVSAKVGGVRGVAKQLRRVHANVMLEFLDVDQARKVVDDAIRRPVTDTD